MWGMIAAGTAVVFIFLLTPWNFIPTQVTENITMVAVTDHGCVGEPVYGVSVVVPECSAQIGEYGIYYILPSCDGNEWIL